jgi:hypothetical protein
MRSTPTRGFRDSAPRLEPVALERKGFVDRLSLLFLDERALKKWIGNQTLRDWAAKDTIGLHLFPQSSGESVNEFCLPRLRLCRCERRS